mmetsp:Transcript_30382/g.97871  ORF Transcript_30382/g.97871 Transcript_30382/m.97871 type:complete len:140 (-) Transcript_30382:670-1089(-)
MHGGPWLEAYCFDGVKRMCHICGKMGRKVRIAVGDIVLISLRGFQVQKSMHMLTPFEFFLQDNKADVIDKYMPDEVRALKAANELPETVKLNETEEGGEDNFEFGSGGEEVCCIRGPIGKLTFDSGGRKGIGIRRVRQR